MSRGGAWGSLAAYGVRVPVGHAADGPATLPLALTLGRWLLDRDRRSRRRCCCSGSRPDAATDRCLALGEALADRAPTGSRCW